MGIKNLLNPAEVDDVTKSTTSESQLEFVIDSSDVTESDTKDTGGVNYG